MNDIQAEKWQESANRASNKSRLEKSSRLRKQNCDGRISDDEAEI